MDDSVMILIRRLIRIALTLLIVGIVANDAVRVISAFSTASRAMNAALSSASDVAQSTPDDPEPGRAAAGAAAAAAGAQLASYSQTSGVRGQAKHVVVSVGVASQAPKTIVAAAVIGLVRGIPASEWYGPTGGTIVLRGSREFDLF